MSVKPRAATLVEKRGRDPAVRPPGFNLGGTSTTTTNANNNHSISPPPGAKAGVQGRSRSYSETAGDNHPHSRPQTPTSNSNRTSSVAAQPSGSSAGLSEEHAAMLQRRSTEITRFRVFSRVRPFIDEELQEIRDGSLRSIVEMTGNRTILLDPKEEWTPKAQFEFDASLWSIPKHQQLTHTFQDAVHEEHETQLRVYNLVAKPSVVSAFDGFNSCILTYGQTGSGKTYTMMGKYNPTLVCGGDGEEGIIPRVCNDIFQILDQKRTAELDKPESDRVVYRIEVNFVEIYMERVRDLLDPSLKSSREAKMSDAKIRLDPMGGPFVEGVTKYQVENWGHCCQLLERGSQHRTTCATLVHQQSSRSHAIFQITVVMEETIPAKDKYSRPTLRTQAGRINLVDLAGSERGGMTDYVKESAAINTSLLALRRVIDNLVERQNILLDQAKQEIAGQNVAERAALPQVPFRDSVLTWLLSDSIGGNARTTMVATLSPMAKNYGDTLATLQWSSKARNLVTIVKMNDVQTVVTGGMNNKASELSNTVVIQRQTVDSLRDALQQKQDYADNLEVETHKLMKQNVQGKNQIRELKKTQAGFSILRTLKSLLFRNRRKALEKEREETQRRIAGEEQLLAQRRNEKRDIEERVQENEILLIEAQAELANARERCAAIEKDDEAFQHRKAVTQQQYDMIRGQMGADEESCKVQIAQQTETVNALQKEIATTKAETARTYEKIASMENDAKQLDDPQWKQRTDEAERKAAELARSIEALKSKKAAATATRDATKLQHQKVLKK